MGERSEAYITLHKRYRPVACGYERYGLQADIEHLQYEQDRQNYRFPVVEMGGTTAKRDRIAGLVPLFETGRMYLPQYKTYKNSEGKVVDLVRQFIDEEFSQWPVSAYDDMLDCMARIRDPQLDARFPDPFGGPAEGAFEPEGEEVF